MNETILSIIEFENLKYKDKNLKKALDLFTESVKNYKKVPRCKKLESISECCIYACLVLSIDILTGFQCCEIVNNLCTDLETDKDAVEYQVNKTMKKQRKEYAKNSHNRTLVNLVRMCFRKASKPSGC